MFESLDDILTVEEVAEVLKIGTSHTYKIIRTKQLKAYKEGKDWKIPKTALEEYIHSKIY